ncbi:MAG TPA: DEAD/DEAH box helicase [Beijerinckiaceae bacterium]|nr:DEAD/DEAH box helicase [Beijerinckiaceae bacterium]
MSFAELGLSDKVLQAVSASGYTEPTPIQTQAIPHVLARRDVLGIAQTGTGKTAAFTLPMLTLLETGRARARMPRTLILEPTRELAAQVEESFERYGVNHRLNVALLIGGVSFGDQDMKITRGVDVLIATPGRLLDHFERGKLLLTGVELLVIDEADRMLDMGFIPDVEKIVGLLPKQRQTLFFSATMPPEITRLADQFLHNPVRVEASRPATTASTITQSLIATGRQAHEKRESLRDLIRGAPELKNAIIFCNRKRDVAIVHHSLLRHGFSVAALHGDMDQRARMAALDSFRTGEVKLLVASDVAARGLDIPAVSHVLNYDVPHHAEDYVHRIGRTGRAGRTGHAVTLVAPGDEKSLAAIEKLIGQAVAWEGPPLAEGGADERPSRNERGRGRERKSGRDGGRRAGREGGRRPSGEGDRPRQAAADQPPLPDRPRKAVAEARGGRGEAREGRGEGREGRGEAREARGEGRREARQEGRREGRPGRPEGRQERPRPETDRPVTGLGDHIPAFLMRPAVSKGPKPES